MNSLTFLMLAYGVFWLVSFVFIFTIFNRQRKLDEELVMLHQLAERIDESS